MTFGSVFCPQSAQRAVIYDGIYFQPQSADWAATSDGVFCPQSAHRAVAYDGVFESSNRSKPPALDGDLRRCVLSTADFVCGEPSKCRRKTNEGEKSVCSERVIFRALHNEQSKRISFGKNT